MLKNKDKLFSTNSKTIMSKQFLYKILLCGDGAVGKTSIRENYMGRGFEGSYAKTVGADFASHKTDVEGNQVTYQIFDLAGQDTYRVARKSFYKGGQAAFLIFDVQDPTTMNNLRTWIKDCVENSDGTVGTFVMLGNKADLVDTRQVSIQMATEFCQQLAAETGNTFVFLETSAKTGLNIKTAFDIMGMRLLSKHNIEVKVDLPPGSRLIGPGDYSAPSQPVAAPAQPVASAPANDDVSKRLDTIEERLDSLEKRFGKLAQLMKKVIDDSK